MNFQQNKKTARRRGKDGRMQPVKWSAEDEAKFRSLYPITPNRELALIFGLSHLTIGIRASERGLKKVAGGTGRAVPIGTKNIDRKGYWVIKVGERDWRRLNTYIWEEANGPIPHGFRLLFKDRNKGNCSIENLILVSDRENLAINSIARFPKELRQAMNALKKLTKELNEKQN
jgi:hypothetical protein